MQGILADNTLLSVFGANFLAELAGDSFQSHTATIMVIVLLYALGKSLKPAQLALFRQTKEPAPSDPL